MLTGRLPLQGQVHGQGLQDGTVVTQGGGVCQLGREPGKLGQRQWRLRPAVTEPRGEGGREGTAQKQACPDYLLHILDAAIGQGDASYPHGTPVAIGAFPVKLGPSRLIDVSALGAQKLLEDGDYSSTVTPVGFFSVLLSKSRGWKGGRMRVSKMPVRAGREETWLVWETRKPWGLTSLFQWCCQPGKLQRLFAAEGGVPACMTPLLWPSGAITATWFASSQDHPPHL